MAAERSQENKPEGLVTLSWHELYVAAGIGVMRRILGLKKRRTTYHGYESENPWQIDIEGACGECAVAKFINSFWIGAIGDLTQDAGPYQVRTASKDNYRLILHPADKDVDIFVLAIGTAPTYRLAGWLYGSEGKRQEFWQDPKGGRPAFFVPRLAMHAIATLPVMSPQFKIQHSNKSAA